MSNTAKFFDHKKSWSLYKDRLLKNYLPLYLSKILSTKKDTLFIDGFAGRGVFDDGTEGSPLIVKSCVENAMLHSNYDNKIIPIFIESKKKNAKVLEQVLNCDWCYVVNGDYKKQAFDIIGRNSHRNIFLYVDPFGIKHLQYNIFEKLAENKNSVELLINFNSFGFIREGCRLLNVEIDDELDAFAEAETQDTFVNDIENMNRIANGDYWQEYILMVKDKIYTAKDVEPMFVKDYMETLGEDFEFIFQFAIKTGEGNVPKYRMIFATNHIQGALYMSETMIKCNNDMMIENRGNQFSMFDYEFSKNSCHDDLWELLKKASEDEKIIDAKDVCLLMYIYYGPKYLHADIRTALKELESEGKVVLHRKPNLTKNGKPTKFFDFINNTIMVEIL